MISNVVSSLTSFTYNQDLDLTKRHVLLGPNPKRVGVILYHDSAGSIKLSMSSETITATKYTTQIGNQTEWEYLPTKDCYKDEILFLPAVAGNGIILVTELIKEEG